MRKVSRCVLCTLLAAVLVSGCDGPFSLTINRVNEKGPQRNAVIAISDPQIYTRERLLNDRDDEVEFLRQQLAGVNDQDYTPRLKRDLDTLIEVVGALSAKFDPVAAAGILQQSKISSLQSDVQISELENLLNKIQKDNTPAKDPATAENPPAPQPQNADEFNPVAPNTLATEMHKFLEELHSLVLTRVDDPDTKRPKQRDNEVSSATPSEVFRDKMAYRNEILAARLLDRSD